MSKTPLGAVLTRHVTLRVALMLAVVAAALGAILPTGTPQAGQGIGSQSVPNTFRQVFVKPDGDLSPISLTLYTTPTLPALQLNNVSGASLFQVTAAGGVSATGPITLAGATFSGAIKYGVATDYTSGDSIVHGFSVTPTVCGTLGSSTPISPTVFISSSTAFSIVTQSDVTSLLYWMCGK